MTTAIPMFLCLARYLLQETCKVLRKLRSCAEGMVKLPPHILHGESVITTTLAAPATAPPGPRPACFPETPIYFIHVPCNEGIDQLGRVHGCC